jgi:hypothetical protein
MGVNNQMVVKFSYFFYSLIIIFASTRGAFVYHLNLPSNLIYLASSFLLLSAGVLSLRTMLLDRLLLSSLKKAIIFYFCIMSLYCTIFVFFSKLSAISTLYYFVIFPIIFKLIRFDLKSLKMIVHSITIITAIGVVYFYYLGLNFNALAIEEAVRILRPSYGPYKEFLGYSRIGDNILSIGYQASHHDAANILIMCAIFYLSIAINSLKKFIELLSILIFFLLVLIILLTGSVANIIVMTMVSSLGLVFYIRKYILLVPIIVTLTLVYLPLISEYFSDYTYFIEKLNYCQSCMGTGIEKGGMFAVLNIESLYASLITIFFGFGDLLRTPFVITEVGFLRALNNIGIIPFTLLMFIMMSPFYYAYSFHRNNIRGAKKIINTNSHISIFKFIQSSKVRTQRLYVISLPVLAGILTLLHYGSLFRVTSIGLFCVFIAISLKEYLLSCESL